MQDALFIIALQLGVQYAFNIASQLSVVSGKHPVLNREASYLVGSVQDVGYNPNIDL